jgi:ATP-dependent DNA ligase
MGADYGRGKKANYFSSFLVGVKSGINIVPISRVGSGFTDD